MNSIYSRGPQCGTVDNSYEIGKQTLVPVCPHKVAKPAIKWKALPHFNFSHFVDRNLSPYREFKRHECEKIKTKSRLYKGQAE